MTIWAILPAAGIGRRMGSITPKQYLPVCGLPVLVHSINRLLAIEEIEHLVVVLQEEDVEWSELNLSDPKMSTALGGNERFNSVLNGLDAIADRANADDWVLVHDAVRPCLTLSDVKKLITELRDHEVGGLLATPIDNTVKQVDLENHVAKTVDRSDLWSALTPQMFRFGLLHKALSNAVSNELGVTDEASAIESLGLKPKIVVGSKSNIKITHEADLKVAELFLSSEDGVQ
jgi:2-C-methyl-D-erythritol 4-phosphate cytidylyltransferase